jgi:hypothetical protein
MKKFLILINIIVVILAAITGLQFLNYNKDIGEEKNFKENSDIIISSPQPNQVVKSPLLIEGKARGFWFFEAVAPVRLVDKEGKDLAVGFIQTTDDWMTENFVNFRGEIEFIPKTEMGTLIFKKDNPSDLPENNKYFRVPVQFLAEEKIKVKVFFNNDNLDPEFSCNKVFPVEREIPKTLAVARAALEELLKGPADSEKNQGFFTSINPGVKIQKLTIENGVARVDLDEKLEFQVGGSCRVSAIRAQITETLKQFPTVKEVIISINERTEDILQP